MLESDDDLEVMFNVVVKIGSRKVDIFVIDCSSRSRISNNCSKSEDVNSRRRSGGQVLSRGELQ